MCVVSAPSLRRSRLHSQIGSSHRSLRRHGNSPGTHTAEIGPALEARRAVAMSELERQVMPGNPGRAR